MGMYLTTQLTNSDLPRLLRDGTAVAQVPSQADMLLLSLLTTAGYAMPHYYMRSGKPARRYEPSLMTLVVAPPASGKGIMTLSRRLLQPLQGRFAAQREKPEEGNKKVYHRLDAFVRAMLMKNSSQLTSV